MTSASRPMPLRAPSGQGKRARRRGSLRRGRRGAGAGRRGGGAGRRASRGTWFKVALIALILYVAGVLVPLAAWVFAVQKNVLQSAWSTGNVLLFALAVAAALALGLVGWIKRLAQRV